MLTLVTEMHILSHSELTLLTCPQDDQAHLHRARWQGRGAARHGLSAELGCAIHLGCHRRSGQ